MLIGQAAPRHVAHFRRRLGLEAPMLADDDRRFLQGRGRQVQGRIVGDAAQLGGAS
jgi:hypothetical protein